jgi:TRAP-type mannitol/chloroaromatic compound transport system permease large subunit
MTAIYRAALPLVALQFFVIGLVMAFPGLTSWLPRLMLKP